MEEEERLGIPLLSKEEAMLEVRRWLETDKVDPDRIFAAAGDQVVRYGDLIGHLEQDTPDGELLRFAISRARVMRSERSRFLQHLLQIAPSPAAPGGSSRPAEPTSSDDSAPAA